MAKGMKRVFVGILIALLPHFVWAAEPVFTQSLSSEDFRAAGLDQLRPSQLEHLDALVAAYQERLATQARRAAEEVSAAQQKAEVALAAQRAAEAVAKVAKEEAQQAKAEVEARKAELAESKASDKGFFAKAKVLLVPGTQIEYVEIRSTIEGLFEGWSGRTVLRLANGQRWQVFNSDERYFVPPQNNVEVAIRPAALGGYWMYFPAFEKRVRVKLLDAK